MLISYKRGQGSIVLRVKILNSSVSTGAGLTGLTSASSGLIISTIADNEATATTYTVAGSTIETITTLGTYAAPTATKARFKEVDATNHKGVYEIQIADARFAVSSAKSLLVSILGATNAAETDVLIPLRDLDPYDSVRAGLTSLPNAAAGASGGVYIIGGTGVDVAKNAGSAITATGGRQEVNTTHWSGTILAAADTAGYPKVTHKTGTGTGELSITSGVVDANVTKNAGTTITSASGRQEVNVSHFGGTAGTFASGRPEVNATHWSGTILGAADTAGYPKVTVKDGTGTGEIDTNAGKVLLAATQTFDNTGTWTGGLTGAVGSVTGNVGGNVTGSVGSIATGGITTASFAAGAINAAAIAADAIGASELAADAATEIATAVRDISNTSPAALSLGAAVNTAVVNADNANTNAIDARDNTVNIDTRLGTPAGATVSADIAAIKADTGNLVTRITSGLFTGITSLAQWLGLIAGKQVGNTTARTELRATGAGSGTYDETTDSQEATKDAGVTVSATDIRAAIGMASANLDTQLAALAPGSAIDIDVEITETEVEDS